MWCGFILTVIFLTSCSLEKRHYRKGFYLSNHHHPDAKNKTSNTKDQSALKTPAQKENSRVIVKYGNDENAVTIASKNSSLQKKSGHRKTLFSEDECGDLITFKNGDELKAKVMEISEKEIKYKRCDNLDGPLITVNKSDVFMIKYANGTKEVIKDSPKQNNTQQKQNPKPNTGSNGPQIHPLAIVSIVAGLLWLYWLGSIAAIITGAIALQRIKAEPEKYNGKGAAIAGIVLGVAAVALVVIVIFIIALGI